MEDFNILEIVQFVLDMVILIYINFFGILIFNFH